MHSVSVDKIFKIVKKLLLSTGLADNRVADLLCKPENFAPVGADGSVRRFWRISLPKFCEHVPKMLVVAPGQETNGDLAESESVWRIGRHLHKCHVAVPELFGWDKESGVLLFEDLGDTRLQETVLATKSEKGRSINEILAIYKPVLDGLAVMQVDGIAGFADSWCWDTPKYDQALMIERESYYFLRAFWQEFLKKDEPPGIRGEFLEISRRAAAAPSNYFLHRDFQSRNIMIHEGRPWFIDFQGGRVGPLGYDVASLLIDPYCSLSEIVQQELLEMYIRFVSKRIELDKTAFQEHYNYMALQRNLQIVGAFAFLFSVRKKNFFKSFIGPALNSLSERMEMKVFEDFPILRSTVLKGQQQVRF